MKKYSIITDTKIKILKHGVNFKPLNLFTNYSKINKYKTKKIGVKPTIINLEVYDLGNEKNILPSELIISYGKRRSILKLRYNQDSPIVLSLENDRLYFYENDKKIDVEVKFVLKNKVLNIPVPIKINGLDTYVGDYIDIVGLDRISILFFEGCYNWNCGKACKFCDLHPKTVNDYVIKPTTNNLKKYDNDVNRWWEATRENYLNGIKYSMEIIERELKLEHNHLFFMAGNLISSKDVWNIALDVIENMSSYIDFSNYDTYLNIAPHDCNESLIKMNNLGIKQVQYNLEIANKELFEDICPGKIKYNDFVEKLKEATKVFGAGNVRSNFVFGLQDKDEMISEIDRLGSFGIVADYSVFQPKKNTPFQNRETPNFDEVIDFTEKLSDIYDKYNFKAIFCSLSSRSSIINEIYDDRRN
jgi:hypothetical protein